MKVFVIGGGPGGYVCAIKAAQLGAEVHLAEKEKVGGTCLNIGCIPTKALLHTGSIYRQTRAGVAGVKFGKVELNWPEAMERKDAVVAQLTGGVGALLRHNGVTVHDGFAILVDAHTVKVGNETFKTDAVVIAAGSVNAVIGFPGHDLPGVIDSTDALSLKEIPKSIVIVGGGVIGVEFASLFNSIGVKVTIIEMLPRMLMPVDADIVELLTESMKADGIVINTGAALKSVEKAADGLKVNYEKDGKTETVTADKVLVAVGRRACNADMGLEKLGVKMTKGYIDVNEKFESSVKGIYAIGDCNGQTLLAHAAMAQGTAVAAELTGGKSHYNKNVIPSCVYSIPETASCGLTEEEVKKSGKKYKTGTFSLSGNGKNLINDAGTGMIKIIADEELGEILGVHMIGAGVPEMIAEAAAVMNMEGTVEDIVNTIHAHPTVSEAVNEAALAVFGKSLHGI